MTTKRDNYTRPRREASLAWFMLMLNDLGVYDPTGARGGWLDALIVADMLEEIYE